MEAMDITNLPAPERKIEVVRDEQVEQAVDSVSHENVDISFEDLIRDMFDEVIQKKEEILDEALESHDDVESEVLLEDVNSSIANVTQKKKGVSKEIKDDKSFVSSVDEYLMVQEDLPFVECELDISSASIKDKKSTKNVKEELIEEKEEKQENYAKLLPKQEYRNIEHLVKGETEVSQKVESKEKENDDVEKIADNLLVQKPKKETKKLNISVEDLRTTSEVQAGQASLVVEEGQMESFDGEPSFGDSDGKNITSSSVTEFSQRAEGSESVSGNQFSSILAEQIKANSAELVQRGKIVLRDGNVGEIRLQLKPAHLGIVRINLKMSQDKKIKGEVTVSSREAYDAFEDSMGELISSFEDAGFDTSDFDLNWKGGKEEIVREDLRDKYFSPEKTALSLSERLNFTENIYQFGQAENVNVLA